MRTRHVALLTIVGAILGGACRDTSDRSPKQVLAKDSSLAADLQLASDTTAYSEAADVAMADTEGTMPSGRSTAVPPVTMRTGERTIAGEVVSPPPRAPQPGGTSVAAASPPPVTGPSVPAPAVATTGAPTGDACTTPTKPEQRRCLMAYLSRSDVQLDRNYQRVIVALKHRAGTATGKSEPETVHQLRVAQRAWLVYRDTECRRRNRGQEGPLWAPVRARCLGEFSGQRAAELAQTADRLERS